MVVRLVRPDQQLQRLIDLFKDSRAAHPAAALAGWKHATGRTLGKRLEAIIALGNPGMVRELATFDAGVFAIRFDPVDGRTRWHAVLPRDDGTMAALATALVLTGGGSEAVLDGLPVDRLGPAGAPVSASLPSGRFLLASSRDELRAALDKVAAQAEAPSRGPSGIRFHVAPQRLNGPGPLWRRRVAETLCALMGEGVDGQLGLENESLSLEVTGHAAAAVASNRSLDPAWLDWVPPSDTLAAVAVAIDDRPEAWDDAFALADRIERTDPARLGVAPLRTRLNLIALGARVRPEVELWPCLRGFTACVLADPDGGLSAALAFHATDRAAAERLNDQVIPRLARAWSKPIAVGEVPAGPALLGAIAGRTVRSIRRGATVLVAWGDSAIKACTEANDRPERSAGRLIRTSWGEHPPARAGVFWPGRIAGWRSPGAPLSRILTDSPPAVWYGQNEGRTTRDVVRWSGLRDWARRSLDRLPLSTPEPDRAPR